MDNSFIIKRALNNNVIIAVHPNHGEVVLIGKGIGFNKKLGDKINIENVEKTFILEDKKEQEQYKQLIPHIDEDFIEIMNDIVFHIESKVNTKLNEHIHIALTDHIAFALKRMNQGLGIQNPFLTETQSLYPKEYEIAEEVIEQIHEKIDIRLPEGEIGFIALHIHSAMTDKELSELNQHSQLIAELIRLIENNLDVKIDRKSVNYMRLVRHLRHAIDRVKAEERLEEPKELENVLKNSYPLCYNLSWKVIKVMQQALQKKVYDAEAVYLTLHLQRFVSKTK
ncbi:transcription antiterminator [Bacillus sp. HMF5848]|uniref:glucose PTS transporter transcription antiterminator GlcT n=1 Tax=Bacillus sp. HMF5848 TaxID=2495421 RepID=UPI000F7941F4|nr:transcription antiterminator [Bacillus sp. HMF5848]RSK29277.1 transcription antiterminator [Bacillus sp. HMF5848]